MKDKTKRYLREYIRDISAYPNQFKYVSIDGDGVIVAHINKPYDINSEKIYRSDAFQTIIGSLTYKGIAGVYEMPSLEFVIYENYHWGDLV